MDTIKNWHSDVMNGWRRVMDFCDFVCRRARVADGSPAASHTFGGFGPELLELLRGAAEFKSNKLSAAEYDETTWSARTWLTFAMQRVSVAVHKAVAREVSDALGLSAAVDPRGVPRD